MKTKFTDSQLAIVFFTGLIATNSWATATLTGVHFIDTGIAVTELIHNFTEDPNLFTKGGFLVFQPLNRPGLSPFVTTIRGSQYVNIL